MQGIDVIVLGELLVNFIQNEETSQGNLLPGTNLGDAPYNVLVMLAGLGRGTEFIGKVGRDIFGRQLREALEDVEIGAYGLGEGGKVPTTPVLVHKLGNGDRDFSLYRSPGAGMALTPEEVDEGRIGRTEISHFGSLSIMNELTRAATKKVLQAAEKAGVLRSFGPNLRPFLWKSLDKAKEQIFYGLAHCDVLKISDNEIQWPIGKEDPTEGIKEPKKDYDIKLTCVSMGRDGSGAYYGNCTTGVPESIQEDTIGTTGAGDTLCGCILHFIPEYGPDNLNETRLREALRFANAAALIITTKEEALEMMSGVEEIERAISR